MVDVFVPTPIRAVERLGTRTVGGATVTEAAHPANGATPPHAHARPTISVLLAGTFQETVGTHQSPFIGEAALFRSAGCVHVDEYGNTGARVLHLEIPDAEVPGADTVHADVASADGPEWRRVEGPRMTTLAWALRAEMRHADQAAELGCQCLIDEIVAEICLGRPEERDNACSAAPAWLARAVDVLQDRYTESLTIGEIAGEIGVHRVTLSRTFRRHLGTTPGEYLRRIRLCRAMQAISLADRAPGDAAVAVGFYDHSHLCRWMRRETGTTPARLRGGHHAQ